jgi:hypothetical protein
VRSRTADILITSEVLYQLSYGGSSCQITNLASLVNLLTDLELRKVKSRFEVKSKFSLKSSLHTVIVRGS